MARPVWFWLFIGILALAQVHWKPVSFVDGQGVPCAVCVEADHSYGVPDVHQDCHDCCFVEPACSSGHHGPSNFAPAAPVVFSAPLLMTVLGPGRDVESVRSRPKGALRLPEHSAYPARPPPPSELI